MTFYNSGIGTYARPSWRSFRYWKQVLDNKIDLAIAWWILLHRNSISFVTKFVPIGILRVSSSTHIVGFRKITSKGTAYSCLVALQCYHCPSRVHSLQIYRIFPRSLSSSRSICNDWQGKTLSQICRAVSLMSNPRLDSYTRATRARFHCICAHILTVDIALTESIALTNSMLTCKMSRRAACRLVPKKKKANRRDNRQRWIRI